MHNHDLGGFDLRLTYDQGQFCLPKVNRTIYKEKKGIKQVCSCFLRRLSGGRYVCKYTIQQHEVGRCLFNSYPGYLVSVNTAYVFPRLSESFISLLNSVTHRQREKKEPFIFHLIVMRTQSDEI